MKAPSVLLVCSGLDHAQRGFETFARECFEALRHRDGLEIALVKGSGARVPGESVVPTLTRDARLARALAARRGVEPFIVEHVAFATALIPLLAARRPDVVFFSEWHVGRVLAAWRRLSRQRFALVLSNGALAPGGYRDLDVVQQLVPGAIEWTVERGEPARGQTLLPLGFAVEPGFEPPTPHERAALRTRLRLPGDRMVVISAGAIVSQKRIDYLIEEIAAMPEPRPYLLLAGAQQRETPALRALADARLGADGYQIRTVPGREMAGLYRASDAFVLASLWESFGRVLVEALAHGLPCLAHDYPVMRWVLGDQGQTADLRERGAVAAWLGSLSADGDAGAARHRAAYERFSWDRLAPAYVDMLRGAAGRASERRNARA